MKKLYSLVLALGVVAASLTPPPLTVAVVGLAALVVGLTTNSGFLITIGFIVLVTGVVLLILKVL